jgi:dCTP deaminase
VLSNVDIWKRLEEGSLIIDPRPGKERFGGASVDLTLANEIRVFNTSHAAYIDYRALKSDPDYLHRLTEPVILDAGQPLILHPGRVIICSTTEWLELPGDLCGELHGRSSLARIGILPHTAGKVDPGWKGRLTLELSNVSEIPVAFYPGEQVCQIVFHELSSPADLAYPAAVSRYHRQMQPEVARWRHD